MKVILTGAAKQKRGFALLSPEQRKILAARGGKTSHSNGTAYKWTSVQASDAARKSAKARRRRKRLLRKLAKREMGS
jgi:hypothetical protein